MKNKVKLFIASSLDGYIAAPDDDLSFLDVVYKEGEDYGYAAFLEEVDCVLLGRRTYDWLNSQGFLSYPGKRVIVITHQPHDERSGVEFYSGDLADLIVKLQEASGKHIFCDGGAGLIHSLLIEDLVDEMIISVVPVLLGNGVALFSSGRPFTRLEHLQTRTFTTGLVQHHYKVLK